MTTNEKLIMDLDTGTSEGALAARLRLRRAASGQAIAEIKAEMRRAEKGSPKWKALERELIEARMTARLAQSRIQVPDGKRGAL